MPFSYRKSVSLGGGVRMNFSKSGVGFSTGVRGFRVSTGPRGTFVNMSAAGITYRQKIGGPYGQSVSPPTPSPHVPPVSYIPVHGTPISTADASQLVEATSASTLDSLNNTLTQPVYAPWFVGIGLVVSLPLFALHIVLFLLGFGLALFLAHIARQADVERRTFSVEYHLDDAARQRWVAMNAAFATLAKTQMLWRVLTQDTTYDWKRNAGASHLVTRSRATLTQEAAPSIASNLTPYCLSIGVQQLYFLPDRVYVHQDGHYGIVEYAGLTLEAGYTRFIESEVAPRDGDMVGSTWTYINKNGGPDRRFFNNREIPIFNYGVVQMMSNTGLNVLLYVSSLPLSQQFTSGFTHSIAAPATSQAASQASRPSQRPRPQPQPQPQSSARPTPLPQPAPPVPDCCRVLGLALNCTQQEASAKYRELASSYHPDRVHNLAPEFKVLAHRKMSEINAAFGELKRLRGW